MHRDVPDSVSDSEIIRHLRLRLLQKLCPRENEAHHVSEIWQPTAKILRCNVDSWTSEQQHMTLSRVSSSKCQRESDVDSREITKIQTTFSADVNDPQLHSIFNVTYVLLIQIGKWFIMYRASVQTWPWL